MKVTSLRSILRPSLKFALALVPATTGHGVFVKV